MSGDISSAELRQSTSTSQTTPAEEKKIVSKSVELKAKDHSAQDGGTARRPGSTASAESTYSPELASADREKFESAVARLHAEQSKQIKAVSYSPAQAEADKNKFEKTLNKRLQQTRQISAIDLDAPGRNQPPLAQGGTSASLIKRLLGVFGKKVNPGDAPPSISRETIENSPPKVLPKNMQPAPDTGHQ